MPSLPIIDQIYNTERGIADDLFDSRSTEDPFSLEVGWETEESGEKRSVKITVDFEKTTATP